MDLEISLGLAGFSPTQQAVYLYVLDAGHTDAGAISSSTGLPVDDVLAELRGLRERGYIAHHGGAPEQFAVVDPRSFLTAAADALVQDARSIRSSMSALFDRFETARARTGAGLSAQSSLTNEAAAVSDWYAQLQHRASTQVRVFDRPPYISLPMPDLETRSIGKGVLHRALYTLDSFDRPGAWDDLARAQVSGEVSRIVPSLPMKMVIADDDSAVVCLSLREGENDSLLTASPPLVAVLTDVFETHWSRGVPLEAARGFVASSRHLSHHADAAPNAQLQTIIALIVAGATDERIAERLGISVRSVRRRTRSAMEDLGAENRFQFGVLAARAGWV